MYFMNYRDYWSVEKMGNDPEDPIVPNQGTTGNSASPSENVELKEKQVQEFLNNIQTAGLSIEDIYNVIKKATEEQTKILREQLNEIENQIKQLQEKKQAIIQELSKYGMPRTSGRTSGIRQPKMGMSETSSMVFALDGQILPASQIAYKLGLFKNSSTNWKRVFFSVLSGNSGGLTPEEQNEIRNRVSIVNQ